MPTLSPLVDALAPGSFKDREAAIGALVATGDPRVVPILQVLGNGELYVVKASGKVVFIAGNDPLALTDPVDRRRFGRSAQGRCGKGQGQQ